MNPPRRITRPHRRRTLPLLPAPEGQGPEVQARPARPSRSASRCPPARSVLTTRGQRCPAPGPAPDSEHVHAPRATTVGRWTPPARPPHRHPPLPRNHADGRQHARRRVPPDARPLRRGRRHLPRHRRHLQRRRLGGDARAVAGAAARRGRARHQGALRGLRPRRRGARARPHPRGVRRQPAAARRRPHRPLPGARARSGRAAGGDAGGARRAGAGRQGARARRLQLPGLAARVGGRAAGPPRLVAVRLAAAAVLAGRALDRDRAAAVLPRRRAGRAPVGPARRRLPHRPLLARRAAARGLAHGRGHRRPRGGAGAARDRAQLPRGRRGARRSRRRRARRSRRCRWRGCWRPRA